MKMIHVGMQWISFSKVLGLRKVPMCYQLLSHCFSMDRGGLLDIGYGLEFFHRRRGGFQCPDVSETKLCHL